MRPALKSVGLTMLLVGSTTIALCIPANIGRSLVLAQSTTTQDRKAEGDRLFEQGTKQLEQNQNEAAIASFQKALATYRELKERQKEGQARKSIGNVYYNLKDYTKAIDYQQQALTIARKIKDPDLEGRTLNNLGNIYKALEHTAKAIKLYQQSLNIAKAYDNYKLMQITLGNLGYLYRKQGESAKAIQYYQQLVMTARDVKDEHGQAVTLSIIGDIYSNNLKNYRAAVGYYQQGLKIAEKIQDHNLQVFALLSIANTSFLLATSQADYQDVIELAKQGLAIAQNIQASDEESRALAIVGNAYNSLMDYQKAIEHYQQSVVAAKKAKNEWREAVVLYKIGEVYLYGLENYTNATNYARQSLLIAKRIGNRSLEADVLSLLGSSFNSSGDSQKAIDYHLEALAIDREIKNRDAEARHLLNLSISYWSIRDYHKSIELTHRILIIAKETKDRYLEAVALLNLGVNAQALNNYQEGIRYDQLALEIYREVKDYSNELLTLHNLNCNYLLLGDYQKVKEYSQRILDLGNKTNNREYQGTALAFLGFAYFAQGNLQTAIDYGQRALKDGQETKNLKSKSFALLVLSTIYSSSGDYSKALDLAQQSLIVARELKIRQSHVSLESLALNIIGTLYRKTGQEEKAIAIYRESLRNNATDSAALAGLARVYRGLNQPITAITYYKQALSEVEQTRRKISNLPQQLQNSFLKAVQPGGDRAEIADIYRELADLLLSQGRISEAQQVLELLKIQELNDFTKGTRAAEKLADIASNDVERSILKQHGTLIAFGQTLQQCIETNCARKAQLLQQRTVLVEQYNRSVQQIEMQFRENSAKDLEYLKPNSQFSTTAQNIIDKQREKGIGTALLYPLVLDNKLWIVLVTEGGVLKRYEVAVSQKDLSDAVVAFQEQLRSPQSNIQQLQATSQKLYNWIIPKALKTELNSTDKTGKRKVQHLVFALDRVTRYIPMSALFDGKQYLIENYAISTITAASQTDWIQGIPSDPQQAPALALGVSEAKGNFAALPNVPNELDAIVQKDKTDPYGSYPGSELLNGAFTFESLSNNLAGHRILHIATHGQFVPGRANDSYLLLGNGKSLAIPEINTLQELRKVDLVVLSACETALGGTGNDGIEINGISSYFLSKGAKAVMASLWLVNDTSTSSLMQQFYKKLAIGKQTKAEALRRAQLSLLQSKPIAKDAPQRSSTLIPIGVPPQQRSQSGDFSHPYYWAPFILIGNGL